MLCRVASLACCLAIAAGAVTVVSQAAQPAHGTGQGAGHASPLGTGHAATLPPIVNTMCPIAHEAIDGETFVEVNGVRVGFCCAGCDEEFAGWTAQRKAAFIAESQAAQPEHHDHEEHADGEHEDMPLVFSFYLPDCPLMGREISAEHPITRELDGREVRFCCARCAGKFDADPEGTMAKIDEKLIADQLPYYPLTTCLVMQDEELPDEGAINVIYKNRLVRFCCDHCVEEFNADPEAYLHTLDAAVAEAQGEHYPLTDCVVAGHAVADGEHPTEVVVGGRLIRLCCEDCLQELTRNPAPYVKAVDEAWAAAAGEHR